jgi:hypothetical protein
MEEDRERGVADVSGGGRAGAGVERGPGLEMLPLRLIRGTTLSLTTFAIDANLPSKGAGSCEVICHSMTFE